MSTPYRMDIEIRKFTNIGTELVNGEVEMYRRSEIEIAQRCHCIGMRYRCEVRKQSCPMRKDIEEGDSD